MAQNTKLIRALEEKQTTLLKDLEIQKTDLGLVLLENDAVTLQYKAQCDELQKLHAETARLQNEIGTAANHLAESDATLSRLESELKTSGYRLGDYLFEQYSPAFESVFGEAYTQATNSRLKIQTQESELAKIETEIQSAGFFKKMPLQLKKKNIQSAISSEQTKMKQVIKERGYAIAQEQLLSSELGGTVYAECCRIRDEIQTEQTHRAELTASKSDLDAQLKSTREGESALIASTENLKKQCSEKALVEAESYVAQYLDGEGVILKEFPENHEEMLDAIKKSLVLLKQNRCQIEIKKLEDNIADCTAQIQKMQNEYESNLKTIAELESKNKTIQENIAGSESLLENYQIQMAEFVTEASQSEQSAESAPETENQVESAETDTTK